MSAPQKPAYRKRRLFPRTLEEVVKSATNPMMARQGKLMGALLRDWETIVGTERAAICRPERLQFANHENEPAVLHLNVRPAAAPSLTYEAEAMLEQCARYFGYRAIGRLVLHPTHGMFADAPKPELPVPSQVEAKAPQPIPAHTPPEMRGVLERLAALVAKNDSAG